MDIQTRKIELKWWMYLTHDKTRAKRNGTNKTKVVFLNKEKNGHTDFQDKR